MVNTTQQVGGSIGTALLNTIAASALAGYIATHGRTAETLAAASVHSYVVAFTVVLFIFLAGAVITALVLPSGVLATAPGDVAVVPA
jgi:hypothetical protein